MRRPSGARLPAATRCFIWRRRWGTSVPLTTLFGMLRSTSWARCGFSKRRGKRASRKWCTSSSAGIFGELKTLPIREDHPIEPDTPYGASKLGGEKLCLAYAKLYPLACVCLRYFNVYGVNQRYDAYGNVIPIFAHRVLNGEPITVFGDGEQTRDFVSVRDVAQANLRAALADGLSGAFNIASGTRVTINRLAELVAHASGLSPRRIRSSARRRRPAQSGRHLCRPGGVRLRAVGESGGWVAGTWPGAGAWSWARAEGPPRAP